MLRSGEPALILVTGRAVRADGLELAGKIAAKTGARIIAQGSNARTQRGRGRVPVERVPYVVDQALQVLAGLKHIILVGAKMPVAFFAYPDKPSLLSPPDCQGHVLARPDEDLVARAGDAGRGGRGARHAGAGRSTRRRRRRPPARSTRRPWPRRSRPCCRRTPSSPTRR